MIGYVCNRYPAVSNTFILQEVRALRRLGEPVQTFSVRRPRSGDVLSEADRDERQRTSYLLPAGIWELARAHVAALIRSPARYLATLGLALRLAAPGLRGRTWQLLYFGEAILLWHRCRARGVRHLHAHFAYVACDDALLAAHMGGWTWSFSMHGPPEFYDVTGTRLAEKVRRADAVICISDFTRSQLMGLVGESCWSKLHVVRCGISPGDFTPRPERNGADPTTIRVLTVARLAPVKGHAVLLAAIAELAGRGVPVRATLVGEGPERGALETLVERLGLGDRVELAGAVGQDEIRERYEHADVFCLPSFAEGLPIVLMEAMAMELPVVATRIMGVPELVRDGVNGLLVSPGRADQLAEALARVSQDPELRRRMAAAGREKVLHDHDVTTAAGRLRDVYRELGVAA